MRWACSNSGYTCTGMNTPRACSPGEDIGTCAVELAASGTSSPCTVQSSVDARRLGRSMRVRHASAPPSRTRSASPRWIARLARLTSDWGLLPPIPDTVLVRGVAPIRVGHEEPRIAVAPREQPHDVDGVGAGQRRRARPAVVGRAPQRLGDQVDRLDARWPPGRHGCSADRHRSGPVCGGRPRAPPTSTRNLTDRSTLGSARRAPTIRPSTCSCSAPPTSVARRWLRSCCATTSRRLVWRPTSPRPGSTRVAARRRPTAWRPWPTAGSTCSDHCSRQLDADMVRAGRPRDRDGARARARSGGPPPRRARQDLHAQGAGRAARTASAPAPPTSRWPTGWRGSRRHGRAASLMGRGLRRRSSMSTTPSDATARRTR